MCIRHSRMARGGWRISLLRIFWAALLRERLRLLHPEMKIMPSLATGRILTQLPAECGRPRPQQATDFLSAQENDHWVVFFRLLRPRMGALRVTLPPDTGSSSRGAPRNCNYKLNLL